MTTIFKYKVTGEENIAYIRGRIFQIQIHDGADIISARVQHGNLCVWAKINTESKLVTRNVYVIGTGCDMTDVIDKDVKFIDTIFLYEGYLVYHIFA